MIFAWDDLNRDHIARHGVNPEEAEHVVRHAENPFPQSVEDDKFVVWGVTEGGRHLQVIFVFKTPDEISYESLAIEDWMDIEAGNASDVIRVIHAMELTDAMKHRLRKRRK